MGELDHGIVTVTEALESFELPQFLPEPVQSGLHPRYPFAPLVQNSATKVELRVFCLENPYLRVKICPSLGGRIVSLFQKQLQQECIPSLNDHGFDSSMGNLPVGLEWSERPHSRPTGLSPVRAEMDEFDQPCLVIGESRSVDGFSHVLRFELSGPKLRLTWRLLNRESYAQAIQPALGSHFPFLGGIVPCPFEKMGTYLFDPLSASGCAIWSGARTISLALPESNRQSPNSTMGVWASPFSEPLVRAPRQLDEFSLEILPFAGVGIPRAIHQGAADDELTVIGETESEIHIWSTRRSNGKAILEIEKGEVLEAPIQILPELPVAIPKASLPGSVLQIALKLTDSQTVIRASLRSGEFGSAESGSGESGSGGTGSGKSSPPKPFENEFADLIDFSDLELEKLELEKLELEVKYRATVALVRAYRAFARRDFSEAELRLEQSLLYNGDDGLAWTEKALAQHLNPDQENPDEETISANSAQLNAHYLVPFEPLLRFIGLGHEPNAAVGPHPLIAALAEYPEELVSAADHLLSLGLLPESRWWLDESIDVQPLPILLYYRAFLSLVSGLSAEAAADVQKAEGIGHDGLWPFTARDEKRLRFLAQSFPTSPRLNRFLRCCHEYLRSKTSEG